MCAVQSAPAASSRCLTVDFPSAEGSSYPEHHSTILTRYPSQRREHGIQRVTCYMYTVSQSNPDVDTAVATDAPSVPAREVGLLRRELASQSAELSALAPSQLSPS